MLRHNGSICDEMGITDSRFTLIEDDVDAPGGFVLYHALKQALKDGKKVDD